MSRDTRLDEARSGRYPVLTGELLEAEVAYAIERYPEPGNCTTRVEYSMALEIRRLQAKLAAASLSVSPVPPTEGTDEMDVEVRDFAARVEASPDELTEAEAETLRGLLKDYIAARPHYAASAQPTLEKLSRLAAAVSPVPREPPQFTPEEIIVLYRLATDAAGETFVLDGLRSKLTVAFKNATRAGVKTVGEMLATGQNAVDLTPK